MLKKKPPFFTIDSWIVFALSSALRQVTYCEWRRSINPARISGTCLYSFQSSSGQLEASIIVLALRKVRFPRPTNLKLEGVASQRHSTMVRMVRASS